MSIVPYRTTAEIDAEIPVYRNGHDEESPWPGEEVGGSVSALPAPRPVSTSVDSHARTLQFYTAVELAALTTGGTEWFIRGFVAPGAITEIDGKIKSAGKTTLTLHVVRALIDGQPFLGIPTRRARVIYVTEQSRDTFMDALRLASLDQRGDELLILTRDETRGADWPTVVAACKRDGYDVVVIDTIGKLSGIKEENSAGEWSQAMNPLLDLRDSGRAVILDRHDRKSGGDVGDSGRGSSQASGDVDIILALRRPEGHQPSNRRVIESLSRYRETPEKIVVELAEDGYVLLGSDEAVAASDALGFVSAAIGWEFRQTESGLTMKALVELGQDREPVVKRTMIQAAIDRLVRDGEIARSGRGVAGDPFLVPGYKKVRDFIVSGPVPKACAVSCRLVVVQRVRPSTNGPFRRDSPKERAEQQVAQAVVYLELYYDSPRRGDRRLLERAREALEQALAPLP